MMDERNLLASMNLWEEQELLYSVFDFMRMPWLQHRAYSAPHRRIGVSSTLFAALSTVTTPS